jgi:PHD/YefM family antitoxin component YafN of YafNO toxin-antitoxin module
VALASQYIPQSADPRGKITYGIPKNWDEDQFIGRIDWVQKHETAFLASFSAQLRYHVYTIRWYLMQTQKVGIREFRERLAMFLEASGPVAITRHGETVGYYIPARSSKDAVHLASLRKAAEHLDALLAAKGVSEDELVNDFKEARRRRKKTRT